MDKNATILFADDDDAIREVLRLLLQNEGFQTIEACNGQEVLDLMNDTVDLLILDVMMSGMNGFKTCAKIREHYTIPVLFLTAKSMESDKMLGFSSGGDDYLVKPFSYNELILRVKAMLRRYREYGAKDGGTEGDTLFCFEDIEINTASQTVFRSGREIALTKLEYEILTLLASHRKKVFSIQNIYESIWNEPYYNTSANTVMVHIRHIREKLGGQAIKTVWGKGYRIE